MSDVLDEYRKWRPVHDGPLTAPPFLVAALLLLFGLLAATEVWQYLALTGPMYSDFFGIWSWSRFVATEGVGALYDQEAMHRFQFALDPLYAEQSYPYLYPPTYLLFIWPLGHLPLGAARLAWSATTLAAFLAALCAGRWRPSLVVAGLVAPATVLCLICGQNGLLTAALMLGGLRCLERRPRLAGLLLGLLTYKPHLALLVPVALVAARRWPALLAAGLSAGAGVAISCLLFGDRPWADWLAAQQASWATVDAFIAAHLGMIPTVSAALRELGLPIAAVHAGQALSTALAAAAVWFVWRHRVGAGPILAVPIAALLATPYAFLYDLPMLAGAALLAITEDVPPLAAAGLGSALLLPQLMFGLQGATLPVAAPVLALLLAWLSFCPRDGACYRA